MPINGIFSKINNSKQLLSASKTFQRHCICDPRLSPKFRKLKEKQKQFQVDDGTPVFIKSGARDKILFNATWLMTVTGLGLSVQTFIRLVL